MWDFEFSNFCLKFSYYIKQNLNNFRNQDCDIYDVCDIMINERKIMKKMQHNMKKQANFMKASKKFFLLRVKLWYLCKIQDVVQERKFIEEMTSIFIHYMQ